MKRFRPFPGFVLVRPSTAVKDTDSAGLTMVDTAKEAPNEGEVVEVGTEYGQSSLCCAGETIAYTKHAGKEITLNDEKLLLLRNSEILGAFEEIVVAADTGDDDDDMPF